MQPQKLIYTFTAILFFFLSLFAYTRFVGPVSFSVSTVSRQDQLFTVAAEGTTYGKPNQAEISLGITTQGSSVGDVQSQANRVINQIAKDVKSLGIEEKDIKTTQYNINPNYDYNSSPPRISGYTASITLQVLVRDLDKINQVVDTSTGGGANEVSGLVFGIDDDTLKDLQDQAREDAIREAKRKATKIASQAGVKLGRLMNVSEQAVSPYQPVSFALAEAKMTEPTQVEPGQSKISSRVTLSYQTL
jgi:uncharacterized protein YggE